MSQGKYIYQPRLISRYNDEVMEQLSKRLIIKNVMRLPKIVKVVLNMGIGDARENTKALKSGVEELTTIAGQKAVVTHAKKAISNFRLFIHFFNFVSIKKFTTLCAPKWFIDIYLEPLLYEFNFDNFFK